MINVNNDTKQAWLSDRKVNTVTISFPNLNLTFGIDDIDKDNFSLKESLCNADSMEFVGCIASSLKVAIYNISDNVKGEEITVSIKAGNTETIPLFKGFVDSVEIDADSRFKTIIAYDALYNAGQVDVASWYARLALPMTLGDIRQSLMSYVGLTEVEGTELPNDDVTIYRTLENPDTIQALTVIKSICQLNGACGIINRDGEFEYRYVQTSMLNVYSLPFFEKLKYEEYYCNAIQRVQIRQMEEDAGVSTSYYGNKYIVQANMFAYELATDVLYQIANNILEKINGFTYHPMRSLQNGLPFVEVGDTIEYVVSSAGYGVDTFLILSRTLTGIQFCRDTFESRGTQNQSEYISDVEAEVTVLRRTASELKNLSTKVVDYILPTTIEESDIASGANSNVIEFSFYNSAENEQTSFYASLDFNISTDANLQSGIYGDCTLTITFIKDGTNVEVQTHTFGDGANMVMLNYLLTSLSKGNHTFKIKFALSGGSMSSIQVISAYILAASVVESGNYEEDYDIETDTDFAEYMEEGGQEIVGEFLELSLPNNGQGDFSGNQFCGEWASAFRLPIEYAQIYDAKKGYSGGYPDPSNSSAWAGFNDIDTGTFLPNFFDNMVYQNTGHHINMWFASIGLEGADIYHGRAVGITGIYLPPDVGFNLLGNYPTQGYALFDITNIRGEIYIPWISPNKNWEQRAYNGSQFTDQGAIPSTSYYSKNVAFYLVYNPNQFKTFLNGLDATTLGRFLDKYNFVLAECNVSKDKR